MSGKQPMSVQIDPNAVKENTNGAIGAERKKSMSQGSRPSVTPTSFSTITEKTFTTEEVHNLVASTSAVARAGLSFARGGATTAKTQSGKTQSGTVQEPAKAAVPSDEEYDTDLEIDDRIPQYKVYSPERVYKEACKSIGVVPASYYVRNMGKEEVDMCHHNLGPNGTKAMCIQLVSNTCIIRLTLRDNCLLTEGAYAMSDMLTENCYIQDLDLSENNLGSNGCIALMEMLRQNASLTKLTLEANNIGDNAVTAIAVALAENTTLKELKLSQNKIGGIPNPALKSMFVENETLETLDLSWNWLSPRPGDLLLQGMKNNSHIKVLNISMNGLTDQNGRALYELLTGNTTLVELDVSYNHMTEKTPTAMFKGIQANQTLQILRMGGNPISASGCTELVKAVSDDNCGILELDLKGLWVNKEFVMNEKILQGKRDVKVVYEGVHSDYNIMSSKKVQTEDPAT